MDQLVLLGRLHHAAAVQPQRAQDRQHIHVEVAAQLPDAVQDRQEAARAADAGAAVNHHRASVTGMF